MAMVEDYAFAYDCPSFSDRVLCLTTGPLPPEHSAQQLASAFAASSPSLSYDGAGTSGVASAREGPLAKRRKILNDEDLMVEESGAPALTAIAHPPAGTLSAAAAVAAVAQPSPKRNVMIKSSKQRRKAARTLVSDSGDEEKLDTSAEGVEEKEQEQEEEEREEEEEGAGSAERQRDRRRKRRSASEEGQQNVVKIHVSGLLLAAKSRFFRSLFASGMKETHQREVWLQMSKEELRPLQDIIRFIYEGRLHASTFRSLVEVLITADKYDVPSAVDAASRSLATIHFTLEQCEEVLSLATPSQKALVSRCQEVLLDRFGNLDKVWEQDDFWQLSPVALRTLLDCDKCEISSENNLFHVLRTWLAKDKEERQGQLGHILPSIRWPMMDSHFLNDVVAQASWLQSCPSFQALHKEALVWLSFGKKRQQMELASNNQVASNRRYCSRPLPAEPQKKLVFDWEVELKDGAEHYTSSYLLHKGYYFYCELSREGDKIGFFICIHPYPSDETDADDDDADAMQSCFVHFKAIAKVVGRNREIAYTRKGADMFTSLNDGWGWYDFLGSCTWDDLIGRTREFVSPAGTITFSIKIALTKK